MPATRDQLLDAAHAAVPLLDSEGSASDDYGHMTPSVVDALFETGLMHLALPTEVGGDEADLVTQVLVYEVLSCADGSAGWSHMAGATASAFAAAYMGDTAAKEMFAGDRGIHAGQFAPAGTFTAVDGGYQVTGSYSFASGSNHATYITAGGTILRNGEMVFGDNGLPEMRVAAIPRDAIEFNGNWDVLGLRGTGSQDYHVRDVFVPDEFTFEIFSTAPQRGGPVFRIGIMPMTSAGHAGWAMGVAKRAMDEITALAPVKQRLGNELLAKDPVFQSEYADNTAKLRSARAYVLEAFGDIQRAAEAGVTDDDLLKLKGHVRVATTHVTRTASEVVSWAYQRAGSHGLRDGSVLQRCFRDIHAGTQHVFVDPSTYTNAAQVWLGVTEGFVFL